MQKGGARSAIIQKLRVNIMTDQPGRIKSLRPRDPQNQPPSQPPSTRKGNLWYPPPLRTLEDTGLSKLALADLVLKVLYSSGDLTGHQISDVVRLPYTGVLDKVVEFLKREKLVDIVGSGGIGEASYRYMITSMGIDKALEAMRKTQYVGPAPVPYHDYLDAMRAQNREKINVHQADLRRIMTDLVISDEMLSKIGPAVNSGTSIFLYGPPGNGKTTIAEKVGRMILGDDMWIPYAFEVDGSIIQLFDSVNHEISDDQSIPKQETGTVPDPRWIKIRRPMIMVGGELTIAGLDLVFDEMANIYEAPFQVKANGGMFLIDDFGRQQVRPVDLLNRWIVPLEKGVDFLTLANGRKIEVPFQVMIVFSTNMDPKDLVDDAFLRRIRYKIEVGNPTFEQYRDLFKIMCKVKGIPYDEQGLAYLLREWYINADRDLRFVHPRDLLTQLIDIANYLDVPARLTKDLIDRAAASYFVEL